MKPAIAATRHKLQVSEIQSGIYHLVGKLAKRFARREGAGGQGLVEFALILPLILLLISGIVEFGRMLTIYNSVSNAAREAARYGTVVGDPGNGANYYYLDCNGMRAAAKRTSAFAVLNDSDITIVYDHGSGASFGACAQGVQPSPGIANGDRVFVTATTNYSPILPLLPISSRVFTVSAARSIFPNIAGSPQCGDNADNDGDGKIDYPADPGCSSSADTDETDAGAAGCYTLTTSANPGAGGSVSVSPPTAGCYTAGISVVITASPNIGADYGFQYWTDASGAILPNPVTPYPSPVTVVMDGNKTYNANFAPGCYTLTITQPANGMITPSAQNCPGGYTLNTIVTVSVNGNSGYALDYWTGALGGSENPTTLIMSGSKSLSAVMKAVPCFTLTTGVQNGSGTISAPSPAANCSGGRYNQFTKVTLTATASAGSGNVFDHWTIKNTDTGVTLATSTYNPVDASIDQNTTVTVAFAPVECRSLTVSAGVSVNPSPPVNCPANQYYFGTDVTLTATPATGYSFTGWSGNASGATNPLIVTMDADKTISATFTANCYTLTKTVVPDTTSSPPVPSASGSINATIISSPNGTCAGANQYTYNTQLQLQAVPAANYSFSSWSGAVTGTSNPTPLTMWASNASVTARFNANCVLAGSLSLTPPGASSKKIQLAYTNYTGALRTLNTLAVTWPTGPSKKFWEVYFGTSSDLIADPKDNQSPSIITGSDWKSLNRGMIDASAKTLILEFTFDISGIFGVQATFDDGCTGTTVSATYP